MAVINTNVTETQRLALKKGIEPLVFSSQNVDGFNNDDVYEHFKGRQNDVVNQGPGARALIVG